MRFKIERPPTRLALFVRWARFFFLVVGVLALSYCAVVLLDRWLFQAYQTWRFERALKNAQTSADANSQPATSPLPAPAEADRARAVSFGIDGLAGSPLGLSGRAEFDPPPATTFQRNYPTSTEASESSVSIVASVCPPSAAPLGRPPRRTTPKSAVDASWRLSSPGAPSLGAAA